MARKPLIGTVAANVQAHGTGGLNVDGCRVGSEAIQQNGRNGDPFGFATPEPAGREWVGRWPANLILSYQEDEYELRDEVTPGQLDQLAEWLRANP